MSDRPGTDPHVRARVRRVAGAALVIVLVGLAAGVLVTAFAPRGGAAVLAPASPAPVNVEGAVGAPILVHVLGRVARPGLYELREGDRAVDAIAAAGGLADDADPGAVNLARLVADGEQIVVPAAGEVAPGPASETPGRISLNTADVAELETLPRIGPAIAERIVAWREQNGPFRAVEDLLEVSGIGERIVEAVRDLVTT
jgi:competence protein ComEA